ncbi:hypothetical protein J6590_004335 [Homalodisca vitripennis]|nr:hypothetical protein J6590_004335 [Homalodisca vitripennis]
MPPPAKCPSPCPLAASLYRPLLQPQGQSSLSWNLWSEELFGSPHAVDFHNTHEDDFIHHLRCDRPRNRDTSRNSDDFIPDLTFPLVGAHNVIARSHTCAPSFARQAWILFPLKNLRCSLPLSKKLSHHLENLLLFVRGEIREASVGKQCQSIVSIPRSEAMVLVLVREAAPFTSRYFPVICTTDLNSEETFLPMWDNTPCHPPLANPLTYPRPGPTTRVVTLFTVVLPLYTIQVHRKIQWQNFPDTIVQS